MGFVGECIRCELSCPRRRKPWVGKGADRHERRWRKLAGEPDPRKADELERLLKARADAERAARDAEAEDSITQDKKHEISLRCFEATRKATRVVEFYDD